MYNRMITKMYFQKRCAANRNSLWKTCRRIKFVLGVVVIGIIVSVIVYGCRKIVLTPTIIIKSLQIIKTENEVRHMAEIVGPFPRQTLEEPSAGQIHILLNAYMRSGSTYTDRLLSTSPDIFSFSEPFWKFYMYGYFTTDDEICDTRRPICSPTSSDRSLQTVYEIFHALYNCQLDNIKQLIDNQVHGGPGQWGKEWQSYSFCTRNGNTQPCFSSLKKACSESLIRMTKVIRMSLAVSRRLLENDKSLKVIQLFRDPRGVICSRLIKTNWYNLRPEPGNYTAVTENAQTLCRKMTSDYTAGKQLMKSFPNRVKFIRYDDLNYNFRQSVWDDVTSFLGLPRKKLRPLLRHLAFGWRNLLEYPVVDIVDKECSFIYKAVGYVRLSHKELGNKSILSFSPHHEFGI